jgi:hypothetical protein
MDYSHYHTNTQQPTDVRIVSRAFDSWNVEFKIDVKVGLHPILWTRDPSSLGGGLGLIVLQFELGGWPVAEGRV